MKFYDIKLKPKAGRRAFFGHCWIFSNELEKAYKDVPSGSLCRVIGEDNNVVGYGYYNHLSLISARLLTKGNQQLEENFIYKRLCSAFYLRKEIDCERYGRMCYSEADNLPGLVVDRYGDYLCVEILSAGMERLKDEITDALKKIYSPKGILFKNTSPFRELEGLPLANNSEDSVPDEVVIEENGLKFAVPFANAQKTGYYYDQRDNRAFLKPYLKDRRVLDLYSYIGSFAITAAAAGADKVWGIDSSALAVEYARKNAALNNFGDDVIAFARDDSERALSALCKGELAETPDFIILDPPNYVKSKKNLERAEKLYILINEMAMKGLPEGGLLATSTCSHHISREKFMDILKTAAAKAGRRVFLIELRGQAKDHPVLLSVPETEYLHFALLKVL